MNFPTSGVVYIVETQKELFWSPRKMDATYKHVRYRYGQARYKEVLADRFTPPKDKKLRMITNEVLLEVK